MILTSIVQFYKNNLERISFPKARFQDIYTKEKTTTRVVDTYIIIAPIAILLCLKSRCFNNTGKDMTYLLKFTVVHATWYWL